MHAFISAGSLRIKKKLELPSLAEQPAWQPPGMASPHLVHGATAGQASSAELAQKSVVGSASERPATAERRAQGKPVQQKVILRPSSISSHNLSCNSITTRAALKQLWVTPLDRC